MNLWDALSFGALGCSYLLHFMIFFFPLLRDFIVVLLQHHSKKDLQTPGLYPVSPQQKHDPLEHIPIPSQTFSQDKYVLEFFLKRKQNKLITND